MLTAPYSIYVNKRPLRIVFLIENKLEAHPIIDAILADNRNRWGGRYNPIILTDGQTLTDNWWTLLERVDPDVVKSFVTLDDSLITSISRRVAPYLIQQPDSREWEHGCRLYLADPGISVLPTSTNIRIARWAMGESSLVLFETDSKTDPVIKQFTEWNFGGYSQPILRESLALEGTKTTRFPITDAASLMTSLTELCTFKSFTYPIQLCSIPKEALPPVDNDRFSETFHVVIGDTAADIAYFWNRPTTIPQWSRSYLNQVWLPSDLALDPQLSTVLSSFIQRLADPGGSFKGSVRFVSLSLTQERLEEIANPLMTQLRLPRYVHVLHEIQPPKFTQWVPGFASHDSMDLYRASSSEERLTLQEPEVSPGAYQGEHWMADVYVEFRPERYPSISGRQLWWQLPRFNGLAVSMFRRSSRILHTRYPSVLMKRGEPRLDIQLPDDLSLFDMLVAMQDDMWYQGIDVRKGKSLSSRCPYYRAEWVDKGPYLSGLLDLFDGLHQAASILQDRYWRRMFDLLSGRSAHKESNKMTEIRNVLQKRLRANPSTFYENDKSMTWLSRYVLTLARSLPASSQDLPFRTFEEQAMRETEDYNAKWPARDPWVYSQTDLLEALARLTERGVLLMGVSVKCPMCGYSAWHHIDDAKQKLLCGGCNATFPMEPKPDWHYRLNSLVRAAHAEHGLLPVVLVLGQLLMSARSAFVFVPCLDLFEKNSKDRIGDLDIAVICDGKFVIGEVKESRELFNQAIFDKMEDIARRLLPDILLFASMDREPTDFIAGEIKRMSTVLEPLNIAVKWYPLHESKFEPSPVR